jgi:hypothetical protein
LVLTCRQYVAEPGGKDDTRDQQCERVWNAKPLHREVAGAKVGSLIWDCAKIPETEDSAMQTRIIAIAVGILSLLATGGANAQDLVTRTPWGDPDLEGIWTNATTTTTGSFRAPASSPSWWR